MQRYNKAKSLGHNAHEAQFTKRMPQTARSQDANGFLLIKQCPISSFGIFDYSAAQVGITDGDPNRIVKVFRPEAAVSDPEFLASFDVVPFINDHEMLSGFAGDDSATAPEDYGVDGVLYNVGYARPWTKGDLKIFTRGMQTDLQSGKKDVSLGYTCDFVLEKGTFDGQEYEVVQTNMRGNHIALVDVGRVPGARVLDGRSGKRLCFDHLDLSHVQIGVHRQGVLKMPGARRKALDADVVQQLQAQLKQLLPTFEAFLSQEAAEPAHQGAAGAAGAAEGADPNAAAGAAAGGQANMAAGTQAAAAPAGAAPAGAPAEGEEDNGAVPAQPAAAPAAAPAAGGEGGASLEQVVGQLEALLAQLKSAMGGAAPAAEPAGGEGGEGGEGEESGDNEGGESSGEGGEGGESEGGEGEDGVDPLEGTAQEPNASNAPGADNEGGEASHIEAGDGEGEGPGLGEGGQGSASSGPSAGKHEGADAALRGFYGDLAVKTRIVDRLSKVVGTFDGAVDIARATARDVAVYGVKRLKLQGIAPGQEVAALDGYLTAYEAGRRRAGAANQQKAADAANAEKVSAIDDYFAKQEQK